MAWSVWRTSGRSNRFYSSYKGSDEGKADGQTQLKNKSRDEANSREARGTTRMPLPNAKPQSAIDLKRSFTVSQRNKRQQSKWRSDHLQSAVKLFLCISLTDLPFAFAQFAGSVKVLTEGGFSSGKEAASTQLLDLKIVVNVRCFPVLWWLHSNLWK